MRLFELLIPIFIMGLLLPSNIAYATSHDEEIVVNVGIDVEGLINAINNTRTGIQDTINSTTGELNETTAGIVPDVKDIFIESGKNAVKSFNTQMLSFAKHLLSTNPNIDSMHSSWQSITLVISFFYLIIFVIIGLKFLTSGHNIEGREKAKQWLKNAFMMIIGVNVSFLFYKLILETATAITQFVWISGFENFFNESIFAGTGVVLLLFSAASIGLALITLFLRYVFLMLAVMLFPIGIFLYYTPQLQNWGKIIFNLIGIALFMQFIDVIVFVASNQIMLDLTGETGQAFVPALSFALVAIINILMVAYALLKSATSIADNAPILAYAFGALSGQIGTLITALKPQPKSAPLEGNMVH